MQTSLSSFLSDVEDDKTLFLLEKGNLKKKPKEISPGLPFKPVTWVSEGYVLRKFRTPCACGGVSESILGVFHRESSHLSLREQALKGSFQLSPESRKTTIIDVLPMVHICSECETAHGF